MLRESKEKLGKAKGGRSLWTWGRKSEKRESSEAEIETEESERKMIDPEIEAAALPSRIEIPPSRIDMEVHHDKQVAEAFQTMIQTLTAKATNVTALRGVLKMPGYFLVVWKGFF